MRAAISPRITEVIHVSMTERDVEEVWRRSGGGVEEVWRRCGGEEAVEKEAVERR